MIHTDLDFEKSAYQKMTDRFPFIEFGVDGVAETASPRLIKSHLPYEFLPNEVKQGKGKACILSQQHTLYFYKSVIIIIIIIGNIITN